MPLRKAAAGANVGVPRDLRTIVRALREGALSARTYCEARLERIRATESAIKAWAALDEHRALALADLCDAARGAARDPAGELGALHGVPVGVKDIFDTDDLPTEMGSPAFVGNQPARNAALVGRIIAAGGYVLGKAATTEFAFMHPAETRNPWNVAHTPGGSSAGSAAAVAAGHVPVAIGTQTNGSVIRPAAFCGVVGFKPSFDTLPIAGALPFSPTLDQAGVFAPTVADAACFAASLAWAGAIATKIEPLPAAPRIAVLERFPWNNAEPDAAEHLKAVMIRLADAGATLEKIELPDAFNEAHRVHRAIMFYEGAREHAPRQAEHRRVMSTALNAAIDEGLALPHDQYRAALRRRAALIELASDLFEDCDAIASLPAPGAAPARLDVTGDPSFCTLWSLLGIPALTLPTGLSASGLPFGVQLAGRALADYRLLRVAGWCEAAVGFDRSPG
jgi:Asp-tRNA(Asn)/Glu-tRNA(Gln) amidotransferase A subunit family amidase